jgi:toxin YoeB
MAIQTTYTQARANLASLWDEVTLNREIVIIERRGAGCLNLGRRGGRVDGDRLSVKVTQKCRTPIESTKASTTGRRYSTDRRRTEERSALTKSLKKDRGDKKQRDAIFHPEFMEDLWYWVETDRKIALRVLRIVEDTLRDPFKGMGKPEPLKYLAGGAWSRRLTQEHRIVYLVSEGRIDFLQARYQY